MFIPLYDVNKLKHIKLQWVTWSLILINFAIWALTALAGAHSEFAKATMLGLGFIPSVVHDVAELPPSLVLVPADATYITYSFLHGSFFHVGSNMLFLWVFGDNVEDAMGHIRFLIFYFLCAAAGAFVHGLLLPNSDSPLIGASGAVAGTVSAYLILHPKVRVWVLAFGRIPLPLPAYIPLLLWIGIQFFMVLTHLDDDVSWGAHIGGILAGALLILVLRRQGVELFDKNPTTPKAVILKDMENTADTPPAKTAKLKWGRGNKSSKN